MTEGATMIDFAGPWEVFQDVHLQGSGMSMEQQHPFLQVVSTAHGSDTWRSATDVAGWKPGGRSSADFSPALRASGVNTGSRRRRAKACRTV
jgi:hypothetical protein